VGGYSYFCKLPNNRSRDLIFYSELLSLGGMNLRDLLLLLAIVSSQENGNFTPFIHLGAVSRILGLQIEIGWVRS